MSALSPQEATLVPNVTDGLAWLESQRVYIEIGPVNAGAYINFVDGVWQARVWTGAIYRSEPCSSLKEAIDFIRERT